MITSDLNTLGDEELIERLHRAAFNYVLRYADADTGLIANTSQKDSASSISVTGFGLAGYPVAVERGWISRVEAAKKVHATLRFLCDSVQSEDPCASGFKGFYYHFLDIKTGTRQPGSELSMIDTALLLAGILVAGAYFTGRGVEAEIPTLAESLCRRVDFRWARDSKATLAEGWKPESGFLRRDWEGYNEATILYLLALGSPTYALEPASFSSWTATYQWQNLLGKNVLYSGPLFTHFFSHAFVDFRGIKDAFMRRVYSDYFENTIRTIALQREYAVRNPADFKGYGPNFWGISAGDGPTASPFREGGRERRFFGYMARGAPYGPDDGTISPWAMLAALPFAWETSLDGVRALLRDHPQVVRHGRFVSGYNPTLRCRNGHGWISKGCYGLDQGLLVLMIENARSGLIWTLMRQSAWLRRGLNRAGFEGGWLAS